MEMMALFTVLGFLFLMLKFGKRVMKKIIGMDAVVDILVTVGLVIMFGLTGTFSGMMVGIMAGVIFSVGLYMAKRLFPHTVLKKGKWVDKDPGWLAALKRNKQRRYEEDYYGR